MTTLLPQLLDQALTWAGRIVITIVLWLIGRWAVRFLSRLTRKALTLRAVDVTVVRYLVSSVDVVLTIALVLLLLGTLGVQTTSFAALLAAVGVAIGASWAGLLAHFAAGVFLLILRPFKIGDSISAAGVNGVVREIGMFSTAIDNDDNVRVVIGNNRLFGDNIANYSANPWRLAVVKVELGLAHDHDAVMGWLVEAARAVPGIAAEPPPAAVMTELRPTGLILTVSVACAHERHTAVLAQLNRAVMETMIAHGVIGPPAIAPGPA